MHKNRFFFIKNYCKNRPALGLRPQIPAYSSIDKSWATPLGGGKQQFSPHTKLFNQFGDTLFCTDNLDFSRKWNKFTQFYVHTTNSIAYKHYEVTVSPEKIFYREKKSIALYSSAHI